MMYPTILGQGKRLFPDDIGRLNLKLASSKTIGGAGVQLQIYTRSDDDRRTEQHQ